MDSPDGITLSRPRPYLTRMILFLTLVSFLALILSPQLAEAFVANPGLNGLIVGVLVVGALYAFRQVFVLWPEIRWVNTYRRADPGLALPKPPKLLAPMATMFGNRSHVVLSALSMRSLLDSLASRLEEQREISRYMIGLLIFLGLLGTFWGLLATVSSIAGTLDALDIEASDSLTVFGTLREGLQAPLRGMGTAFSSSLFGLAGSLVLGFLDLQAGQAQNRFYNELEEWLSTVTDIVGSNGDTPAPAGDANHAIMALANQITALTEQMRAEQHVIHNLARNQEALQPVLERLTRALEQEGK
ncbi:MAG: flagellar motor protein MotA [Rhodobiaceae bacterium]|nr:MAG: flagellar motor protein MotA [Rhodobiaceae bacterium]